MQKNSYFYRVFASSAAALIAVSLVSTAALAAGSTTSENSPVPVKQEEPVAAASQPTDSKNNGTSTDSKTVAPETTDNEKKAEAGPAADAETKNDTPTLEVKEVQGQTLQFFISLDGKILDTTGNVVPHSSTLFTGAVADSKIKKTADKLLETTYNFAGSAASNEAVNETDRLIRHSTDYIIASFPKDADVFEAIHNDPNSTKFGEKASDINETNYDIRWYVVKWTGSNWHIDGVLRKKEPSYSITYKYVSGTENKELPEGLAEVEFPTDNRAFHAGEAVSVYPQLPQVGTVYNVTEGKDVVGRWTLSKWTPSSDKMVAGGVVYTGTWVYAENTKHTVTVNYYQDGTLVPSAVAQTGYEGSDYAVDSALTSGKTMDGYKYDHTDGSTTGKLDGDKVINVYFVKNTTPTEPTTPSNPTNPTTPSNPTNPTNPTNPSTPSTTVTVPDATTPTASTPDVTIPAAETPTTEAPTTTEIPDAATPLTSKPDATDTHEIPEEAAAKAEAPKTGDNLLAMLLTAAASLGGIVTLSGKRKKNA
jgi:hypothetical protein